MIVATAGHIDHGKTALVRALTGVDTDRLPQEKARGISIDLGYAYASTASGRTIGFVDVPGHERFIRNMLAGVCGIDAVMLVVAADDGVMPQTREHLAIVDILEVANGVVVVSKVDRVSRERLDEVHADLHALIASTGLSGAPIIDVSSVTGEGIETLRSWLESAADAHAVSQGASHAFRYVIDRAFTASGSGTVVTGTVLQGAVRTGDHVHVTPSGVQARVRTIQKNGAAFDQAQSGERCALNLAGVDLEAVGRGRWLGVDDVSTTRASVRLRILADVPHALRQWTEVHLHVGTADVTAHVAVADATAIEPGATALVELHCDSPLNLAVGDGFILRDASAGRTLGGGVVIDPFPLSRRAGRVKRRERLEAMSALDPEVALRGLLAAFDEGVDMVEFGRAFNLTSAAREALEMRVGAQRIGSRALSADRMAALESRVASAVRQFHEHSPQANGMEIAELRRVTAPSMPEATFGTALRLLAARLDIEIVGSLARCAGHISTANRRDEVLWQRAKPRLMEAGFRGIAVSELSVVLRVPESTLTDFLHRKSQDGGLVRVTPKRFYPREVVAQLAAIAASLAEKSSAGSFIAAQFRDALRINRGLAIEILECLDRIGVTQRVGDARKMRSNHAATIGPGSDGATPELHSMGTSHALRTQPRADLPAAARLSRSRR